MYCGTRTLLPPAVRFTDEHIVPYALGGQHILPHSSCTGCQRTINQEIETPVAKKEWGDLRVRMGWPSQTKKRPIEWKVKLKRKDGSTFKIHPKDYSTPVPLYLFGVARILEGGAKGLGDDKRWTVQILTDHAAEMNMKSKFPEWDEAHRIGMYPDRFARLLAKIAHGYAVAEWGYGSFTPYLPDLILGRSNDHYYLVGGDSKIEAPIPAAGNYQLRLGLQTLNSTTGLLIVDIRLIAPAHGPRYHVVVGAVDMQDRQHRSTFNKYIADGKVEKITVHGRQVYPNTLVGGT